MGQAGRGREGRPGARAARSRVEDALDLTTDQKTAIASLRAKAREETTPLVQELRTVQRDLRQQVRGGTANAEAAKALAARAVTLRQQLADARTKTREAITGQLTDEQRTRLNQVRARLDDRPGPRARAGRGRGPENGPGRAVPNGAPGPRGPRDGFGRV
jgi:Spy/CpxP family protein refolding chaperone